MKIYFLSGLGADKRAFQFLEFDKITHEIIHLDWISPLLNESIFDYCKRLCLKIDTNEPFSLVGLSFGGIIAIELLKIVNPQKVVLISSVASNKEYPWVLKLASGLKLYKLLPGRFYNKTNRMIYRFFGVNSENKKDLLKTIIRDSDVKFIKWAIVKLMNWKNDNQNTQIIRIHGDKDKLFPVKTNKIDFLIKEGGHFMIVDKAREISSILQRVL